MKQNLFTKLYNTVESHVINRASNSKILVEALNRRGVSGDSGVLSGLLESMPKNQQAQSVKKWKDGVALATNPDNPDRTQLMLLNDNLMLDSHLASLIDTIVLYVQRSARKMVDDAGEENKDVTMLLERQWFDDLIRKVIFHVFQGTTLLEMYELNEEGELVEVCEIPQSHFIAKRGIVIKSVGSTTGWSYREGIYAPYYVQIGKDDDLGMLERLAPIVLAKKLAIGSYLDYIEKYGVPPLFITTDREDDDRLKELFDAASKFKSNHFMVGRGQEKFEVGNITGQGVAPFETLIKIANDELSKRIIGGSGITDEKGFVGSAQIQFTLAKDRFESYKLLFKYIFNNSIKPRLVALSPVYAPLASYKFDWDDTENMTKQEIIKAAVDLGSVYEVDPEWIFEQTGIPVLGLKQGTAPTEPTPPKK